MKKILQGAVLICPFRPFFVLTGLAAVLFMAVWLLALNSGLGTTSIPGSWTIWHAHELLFGFAAAATAGFALTAIPEFTRSRFTPALPLAWLSSLWLLARLAYFVAPWLALLFNLAFWLLLLWRITPPVWQDPQRKHLGFPLAILTLAVLQAGFFIALLQQQASLPWLYASAHVFMILIVLAASRVSMSVVNNLVEGQRSINDPDTELYLARPPRRYLAITCIGLCAVSELYLGANAVTGWIALAAMAALLNLLNDWHVGRPLFARFALLLYASYWLMALGYGLLGAAWLGASILPSAARHLMLAGSMSLVIFTIMCIVSRIHSGLWLDRRPWLPAAAIILVSAAIVRTLAGVYALLPWYSQLLVLSGLLWMAGFVLYALHFFSILFSPRRDGRAGCAEPVGTPP